MTVSSENIISSSGNITSILHYPCLFGYTRPGATPATSHQNIISIFSFIFCQDREIIHFTFSYLPLFSVSFWASYFIPVLCQAWLIKPELCRESLVYGWRNSKLSKDKVDIKPVVWIRSLDNLLIWQTPECKCRLRCWQRIVTSCWLAATLVH